MGAFAQTSEGDASPNLLGGLCDVTFDPCSYERSTCPEDPSNVRLSRYFEKVSLLMYCNSVAYQKFVQPYCLGTE